VRRPGAIGGAAPAVQGWKAGNEPLDPGQKAEARSDLFFSARASEITSPALLLLTSYAFSRAARRAGLTGRWRLIQQSLLGLCRLARWPASVLDMTDRHLHFTSQGKTEVQEVLGNMHSDSLVGGQGGRQVVND
jgi:hypothetical protein